MNTDFEIKELELKGVKLVTPFYVEDNRGYFLKNYEKDVFESLGLPADVHEDFESYSKKGVIRGLHFQTRQPQGKLVRAIRGEIHDIVVDLRKGSESFGRNLDVILTEENHKMLWVPAGFAHGFEVLSEDAVMSYKCFGRYLKGYDAGIRWNDEDLSLKWQTDAPVLSERDAGLMTFREFSEQYSGL
ncbi:MAG: dTDP-4-dehydrorhamnose 3,5-epimerase [Eubacterium sp.]|jgi:dTDP-4-dehydrorhamnose 3,5-epimerase|nr:dTDP-4-dehydrorhamnose 3,5-epimerase [Eubacterium sp.]